MKAKWFSFLIVIGVILSVGIFCFADNEPATYASGTWGNLNWTLDSEGTLSINGNGGMDNFINEDDNNAWRAYKDDIKNVEINYGITSIGDFAFYSSDIEKFIVPASVTSIGKGACGACIYLTNITIPASVTSIGDLAFGSCPRIKSAGPIESGCNYQFGWTENIPAYAFAGLTEMTDVTIPVGVKSIGSRSFLACWGLEEISIPKGTKTIDKTAFWGCVNLKNITIPRSVTTIGEGAFHECNRLDNIVYGGTQQQWNNINKGLNNDALLSATIHYAEPHSIIITNETLGIISSDKNTAYEDDIINLTVKPNNGYVLDTLSATYLNEKDTLTTVNLQQDENNQTKYRITYNIFRTI